MDTIFISDSTELKKILHKKKLPCFSSSEALKKIKKITVPTLVYADPGITKLRIDSIFNAAGRNNHVLLGVIDPKNKIRNVMDIIWRGAVDYISAKEITKGLMPTHFPRNT